MPKSTTKERKVIAEKRAMPVPLAHSFASILVLITVTIAVYGRCTGFDYVHWDDHLHVYQNPYLASFSIANLKRFWSGPYEGLYIPLSYTVYALIARSARMPHFDKAVTSLQTTLSPHPFHAVNVALHLLNVLLVFALLRKLLASRVGKLKADSVIPALAGALLFSVHPLQVESVAWISELRGLLCAFFSLASLLAFSFAVLDARSATSTLPLTRWTYWASLVLFALACLCKPSTVALPLALIAIDFWAARRPLRSAIASAIPFALMSIYFVVRTHGAQPVPDRLQVPLWTHPFVAGDALAFYLAKLVCPWGLTIDYGRKPSIVIGNWWGYATWGVPAVVAFVVYRLRKSMPLVAVGSVVTVSMLLPVLGLVAFIYQDYSTVADRYMYLGMLGPAVILAAALSRVSTRTAYVAAGVALAALTAVTVVQVGRWQNSFTLFEYAVRMNPDGYQMRENYGIALKEDGKLDEAVEQFNKGIEIEPGYSRLYNDLGLVELAKGDVNGAIQSFQLCVDREPGFADGHRDLGAAQLQIGQTNAAIEQLKRAVDIEPLEATCHNDYANALLQAGRAQEAAVEYHAALAVDPSMPESLFGLADALVVTGDKSGAEAAARQAIAIEPGLARAHGALARALDAEGRLQDAVAEYRQAIAINPNDALMHYNLACAYFNRGDQTDAIPELQQASTIDPNPSYFDGLGMAYLLKGDRVNARSAFEQELRVNPNSTSAKQELAKLGP